jgi:hypothetical protein
LFADDTLKVVIGHLAGFVEQERVSTNGFSKCRKTDFGPEGTRYEFQTERARGVIGSFTKWVKPTEAQSTKE